MKWVVLFVGVLLYSLRLRPSSVVDSLSIDISSQTDDDDDVSYSKWATTTHIHHHIPTQQHQQQQQRRDRQTERPTSHTRTEAQAKIISRCWTGTVKAAPQRSVVGPILVLCRFVLVIWLGIRKPQRKHIRNKERVTEFIFYNSFNKLNRTDIHPHCKSKCDDNSCCVGECKIPISNLHTYLAKVSAIKHAVNHYIATEINDSPWWSDNELINSARQVSIN